MGDVNGDIIPIDPGPRPPDALTWPEVAGYKVVMPVHVPKGRVLCFVCKWHFAEKKDGLAYPHHCIGNDCDRCGGPCRGHRRQVTKTCRTRAEAEAVLEAARKEIGDEERQVEFFR